MKVAILGAGFSGLTLARALQKRGFAVEVFESTGQVGGLIQTSHQKVMVEAAAHALLSNRDVEDLFKDLGIEMVRAGAVSHAKWIFRKRPRRWPLTVAETFSSLGLPRQPLPQETVAAWAQRCFSQALGDFLVAPALQGVYGAPSEDLSATLILAGMLNKSLQRPPGAYKGSVAPKGGMSELLQKLATKVTLHLNSTLSLKELKEKFDKVVVATSLCSAANLLAEEDPELSQMMMALPRVSLLSATISLAQATDRVRGFGCLFPAAEKFESLGVLFNSDIFVQRGPESETWIFAGDETRWPDSVILDKILKDRQRITSTEANIDFFQIHRWPQTLPLYGLELEKFLKSPRWQEENIFATGAQVNKQLYLTGNYLGGLGLTKILGYNERLADRMAKERI